MGEREFADVLREAIQARGLGLEQIRERLLAQGVSGSLATLSYWHSGRSRPERRDSLAAVELLELASTRRGCRPCAASSRSWTTQARSSSRSTSTTRRMAPS